MQHFVLSNLIDFETIKLAFQAIGHPLLILKASLHNSEIGTN
jgi:hypothetical protein